jgi:hypothetical protein
MNIRFLYMVIFVYPMAFGMQKPFGHKIVFCGSKVLEARGAWVNPVNGRIEPVPVLSPVDEQRARERAAEETTEATMRLAIEEQSKTIAQVRTAEEQRAKTPEQTQTSILAALSPERKRAAQILIDFSRQR